MTFFEDEVTSGRKMTFSNRKWRIHRVTSLTIKNSDVQTGTAKNILRFVWRLLKSNGRGKTKCWFLAAGTSRSPSVRGSCVPPGLDKIAIEIPASYSVLPNTRPPASFLLYSLTVRRETLGGMSLPRRWLSRKEAKKKATPLSADQGFQATNALFHRRGDRIFGSIFARLRFPLFLSIVFNIICFQFFFFCDIFYNRLCLSDF